MTRRSINLIQFWLTAGFFSVPAVAFALAGYFRFKSGYFPEADVSPYPYIILTVLVTLLWAFVVEHLGLNKLSTLLILQTGVLTATKATVYCLLLALSVLFFYRLADFARIFVAIGCLLMFLLSLAIIHFFRGVTHAMEKLSNGRLPIAVLGADAFAQNVAHHLCRSPLAHCRIGCYVVLPGQVVTALDAPRLNWDQLDDVVETYHCEEIVAALPPGRLGESQEILQAVRRLCIPARLVLDFGQGVFVPDRIFDFYGMALLDVRPYPLDTVSYAVGKRVFDVLFSLCVLLLASPLLAVISLLIKLTSRGPVRFEDASLRVPNREGGCRGVCHPPATMQKREKKRVAGGASWKLLKTKVQICSVFAKQDVP